MYSDEYYSRNKIKLIIGLSLIIYFVFLYLSYSKYSNYNNYSIDDFTKNYDSSFKTTVEVSNLKEEENEEILLSSIEYDPSTLYLDWTEIEEERSKIEEANKQAIIEAAKKNNFKYADNSNIYKPEVGIKELASNLDKYFPEDKQEEEELLNSNETNSTSNITIPSINNSSVKISNTKLDTIISFNMPTISDTSFKGYMCMHKVTSTTSKQYKFLHSGLFELTTNKYGIMMYKDYYVVAMASYYTNYKVGSTFRITLDTGIQFDVITGDEKADGDTDSLNMYRPKGSGRGEIVEFIIACGADGKVCNKYHTMSSEHRALGNLSSLGFEGNVVKVEKLDDYEVVNKLYN